MQQEKGRIKICVKYGVSRKTAYNLVNLQQSSWYSNAIEVVGAYLAFLPPYSPDLNPIEEMWSKIKSYLRKVKARSQDVLLQEISNDFRLVCADDAQGWFWHSGYTNLYNF